MSKKPKPQKTGKAAATPAESKTDGTTDDGERKSITVEAQEAKPKLEPEDLYRAEMFYAKMETEQVRRLLCEEQAARLEMEAALKVRAIRADGAQHEREAQRWKASGKSFMLSLNDKYGVDFSRATYDDQTGVISVPEPTDEPEKT
jgi:hypothetical protein